MRLKMDTPTIKLKKIIRKELMKEYSISFFEADRVRNLFEVIEISLRDAKKEFKISVDLSNSHHSEKNVKNVNALRHYLQFIKKDVDTLISLI